MDLGAVTGVGSVSEPARVAAADEAISAELEPALDKRSWVRWSWEATTPGRHPLSARAHDASGRSQPWSSRGTGAGSPTTSSSTSPS
jgi:hypothetical protein